MPGPSVTADDGSGVPDRRHLVAVAIQFFVNGALWASVAARLPEVRDQAGVTVAGLGLILSLGGVIGLVGSWSAGWFVGRWGTRRVLIVAGAGLVGAIVLVATAAAPWVLVVGVAVLSFSDVVVDIAMNLQGSWISARRPVPVMNRLHGLWSLGTVTGGLGAAAAASASWSLSAHVLLVAVLGASLLAVAASRLLPVDGGHADADADAAGGSAARVDGESDAPAREPRSRHPMLLLALAGAFALVMEQTASDWAAFRLADDFGADAALAGLAYVAFTAGMTAARFGGDFAQVRLGRDRLHRVAVSLAAVGLAVAALGPSHWPVLAGYAVAGVGIATFFPRIYDDAARLPGRTGAGLGAMTAGSRFAGFIAPSIVGALAATSLSVGDAVAIVSVPCVVGFALVTARTGRR